MGQPERSNVENEKTETEAKLSPERQDLLRSLEISIQQAVRGETRPVWEFLEELRLEREAEANKHHIDSGLRIPDKETDQAVSSS
ncbi:MAG: hypothetical protein OXN94_05965 [Chloroflexota bacterium]|nr:hypothetical protein [Chloroflexota bacterium]MDE2857376.1 hypothetical protein [Chloroflexota bacterium]MDE2950127.1 hypothetical protein [Chloroflexota bacterium]